MNRRLDFRRVLFTVMVLVSLTVGIAAATPVTQNITYQGKLTDVAGNPLTGTYSVTFKLYEVSSGGTALATDTHTVQASKGFITTQITADQIFFDGRALWLGVKIGADAEMTPRQEIRPDPYALSLRPGAIIKGSTGANATLKVIKDDTGGNGVNVTTLGSGSHGVAAYAAGLNSRAVYGDSLQNVGVYGKGKEGGYFTTRQEGTSGNQLSGINVSTSYDFNTGVKIQTKGEYSQGVYVQTEGPGSSSVEAYTTNENSNGVIAQTEGQYSTGVSSHTKGPFSYGVDVQTEGPASYGLFARTLNSSSDGVRSFTQGWDSDGVKAIASGPDSTGVYGQSGQYVGVWGKGVWGGKFETIQAGSGGFIPNGIEVSTAFDNNRGIIVTTSGTNSPGVTSQTSKDGSNGVYSTTAGTTSHAIYGSATGPTSNGVVAYSTQWTAVYADTLKSDHMYGVYTPDYMSAARYDTNAGDVAEHYPVSGAVEAGTVMSIGEGTIVQPSTTAYDTHVVGVVSTNPGVSLKTKDGGNPGEALIALTGRVPCKVDASNGPIHAGDLLTTSSVSGHAMKAQPVNIGGVEIYRTGTILGKAFGTLESGTGVIEVVVTLQ